MVTWFNSDLLMRDYRKRILEENRNLLVLCVGPTGSGKSLTALRFAQQIDPDFPMDASRVAFSARGFMDILTKDQSLKKGSAIILDESGVALSSRTWFSLSNRLLNYVLQSFRSKNLCCIFCAPGADYIDAGSRKLFHVLIQCSGRIDRAKGLSYSKIFNLTYNPRSGEGKTYTTYPVIPWMPQLRFEQAVFSLPSKELVDAYSLKKNAFVDELAKSVYDEMSAAENAVMSIEEGIKKLQETGLNRVIFSTKNDKRFSASLIEHELGCSQHFAQTVKMLLDRDYAAELKQPPKVSKRLSKKGSESE